MLPTIYLASQSPRRQQLLTQIGISFELLLPVDALAAVVGHVGGDEPGMLRGLAALRDHDFLRLEAAPTLRADVAQVATRVGL